MSGLERFVFEDFNKRSGGEWPRQDGQRTEHEPMNLSLPVIDVLLVDDDPYALEEMESGLKAEQLVVAVASNAAEALAVLRNNRVSVLVTDINMPRVSGLMLAAVAREEFQDHAPEIVFVSGYADRETVIEAIRYSPKAFLLKPTKLKELTHAVQQVLLKEAAAPGNGLDRGFPGGGLSFSSKKRTLFEVIQEERKIRASIFDAEIADSPAWQILLDLWSAPGDDLHNYVSSIAIGTGLPLTTALRYIESLLNAGLVERRRDTGDGRRVLVLLTEKARWLFSQYQALLDESL